jgi:hypothetical protein
MKANAMTTPRSNLAFAALRSDASPEHSILRDQFAFLCTVWGPPEASRQDRFGALCFRRRGTSSMIHRFIAWQNGAVTDPDLARFNRHDWDQYFSPNLYRSQSRKICEVRSTRLGWCDVDEADPFAFEPPPSVVWQTSPGRTQALWIWDAYHSPKRAATYSKALTYRHDGDKGGSAPNKLLRLPGSYNHKPGYDRPFIPLLRFDPTPIKARPELLNEARPRHAADPKGVAMNPVAHVRHAVLKKYRLKLDVSTRHLIAHDQATAPDRSRRIFAMVAGLHQAGATMDEIASVVWGSPYFREKYGEDLEALERELSRIMAKLGDAQ